MSIQFNPPAKPPRSLFGTLVDVVWVSQSGSLPVHIDDDIARGLTAQAALRQTTPEGFAEQLLSASVSSLLNNSAVRQAKDQAPGAGTDQPRATKIRRGKSPRSESASPHVSVAETRRHVEFPLIPTKQPGLLHITNEDIARMEEEDDLRKLGMLD